MSQLPQTENIVVDGPAGALECLLEVPRDTETAGGAVICHPHPQHGGTMQNKVVHTLARAFVAAQLATLRFNFRGVGGSEGRYEEGHGELQDALAALQAIQERIGGKPIWLAGFSFGAAVAIRAATEHGVDGLVSVAPAVSRLETAPQPDCPWLIVQGDQDELVAVDDTIAWVNRLEPGPELRILEDAEHFFHGRLIELREIVEEFVIGNRRLT